MAYDEHFADRIRHAFARRHILSQEKKMMGGLCFMVDDKMCVGVDKDKLGDDRLMVRLDPDSYEQYLQQPGARAMDFTGRPMKGFVYLSPEGVDEDDNLDFWIGLALEYNPKAKSSKRKSGKKSKKSR